MKKVLLIILGLLFISAPAGATTFVHYNIAGIPTHRTVGAGHRMSANHYGFGSNAAFTPQNRMRAGQIMRARKMQEAMINAGMMNPRGYQNPRMMTMTPPPRVQMSRFDKNFRIRPKRSIVRNGIICYE